MTCAGFALTRYHGGSIEKVLELACLAPSVGLSQPWRFILVDDPLRRAAVRHNFETCNAEALAGQEPERAVQYPRLSSCLRSFKNFFILGADANANPRGAPELAARPALGETSLTSTYCGLIDAPRLTYSRINSIRGHYTKVL